MKWGVKRVWASLMFCILIWVMATKVGSFCENLLSCMLMFCALFHRMFCFNTKSLQKQFLPNFHMGLRVKKADLVWYFSLLKSFLCCSYDGSWCPWKPDRDCVVGSSIYNKETSVFSLYFQIPLQPQPFPAKTTVCLWQLWLLLVMTSRESIP